jgi:hypothetical protein
MSKKELEHVATTCVWDHTKKPSVFHIKDLSGKILFSGGYTLGVAWREAYSLGKHVGYISFEKYFEDLSEKEKRSMRQRAENDSLKKEIVSLKKTIKKYERIHCRNKQ